MAANSISAINILFGLNSAGFDKGLQGVMGKLSGLKSMIVSAFAGVGTLGTLGFAVKLASEAEMAQAQLEVLLGSVGKAQRMLEDLRALDIESPFDVQQLTEGAKRMLAYGIAAEDIIPVLTNLSEVAMGDAFKLDRLAFVLGQVKAATKMTAQDLRQFTEAGLNPLAEISRITGESMEDLQKKVSDGAISYELIKLALQAATAETGRFHGANERFAKTFSGQWSKMEAEAKALGREIGMFLIPALRSLIGTLKDGLGWLRSWDASQLKISASTLTFGVVLLGAMNIAARLPAIIKSIVTALKAMASAQVLTQALSGPKGWAIVSASIVAAGVATGLVYDQFKKLEDQIADTANAAKDMSDQASAIGKELPKEVLEIKEKMEAELGIKGGGELADALKENTKATRELKPAALIRGSAEEVSARNKFQQQGLPAFAAPIVNAVNGVRQAMNRANVLLDRIERGQQPVVPANIG